MDKPGGSGKRAQVISKQKANPSSFLLVLDFTAEPESHKSCENQSDSLLPTAGDTEAHKRMRHQQNQPFGPLTRDCHHLPSADYGLAPPEACAFVSCVSGKN